MRYFPVRWGALHPSRTARHAGRRALRRPSALGLHACSLASLLGAPPALALGVHLRFVHLLFSSVDWDRVAFNPYIMG